jgi:NTE family protein
LHREELRRYSLPEAEYRTWRERSLRPEPRSLVLADVRVEGTDRVNPEFVRMKLDIAPGQEVRERDIATAVARLFDSDDFDSVDYSFAGDWERPTLVVSVHEKSQSPNIVRFDLGLAMGSGGANAFALSADYLRPWINSLGGEVHGTLQFGRTSHAQLSLYQPVDPAHAWFVEPGVRIAQSREDIYVEDTAATRYVLDTAYGYLDVGRSFGSHAELRAGVRAGVQGAEREIVAPGFASLDTEAYGGLALAYTYDDRDRELLATRGWLSRVHYFRSIDALSAQPDYDRLEAMLERSLPLWGNVLELRATGGANFDGELPVYDYFVLGGPVSFPGLGIGQLRGTSYWSGSALYLHKIADLSPLFGQALYFGAQLNVGDMSGRIDGVREDTIFGGSLLVGGRTPLGPMRFAVSLTSTNEWSVLFALGRPIEERTITDPPW